MSVTSFEGAIPVDLTPTQAPQDQSTALEAPTAPSPQDAEERKAKDYVLAWKRQLETARTEKKNIWNECWQLYRGVEDWTDKEEWQSKIVIPKAWASVKQATNVIKRLLRMSLRPWQHESVNPDDIVTAMRAEQMTDLVQAFMDKANYQDDFAEGLESGFIMGLGVWKVWWGLKPRTVTKVQTVPVMGPQGVPIPNKQVIRQEVLEGQLFVKAVDPYNFHWLPGSKLNRWAGTIEQIEIPRYELMRLAQAGVFPLDKVKKIQPKRINIQERQTFLRFNERNTGAQGPNNDTGIVTLTEYYGPLVLDGEVKHEAWHVVLANDDVVLVNGENSFLHRKPPYVAFSPLALPFRTEGVGLIEMVRAIDKALSRLANLSVDTLMFRLMPVFEVQEDIYENPEDFETGLHPGKIFRKTTQGMGIPGITPVTFEDISQGAVQVQANLDRAHQEGALVSEIQQALPRYRGVQSATEIEMKGENQESFFGSMAADIEKQALTPLVEMATDLVMQYIDTANDPRVASILGVNADVLRGMSREEVLEMIQGDYKVKVTGISGQLEKAELLQNLVQFMNIIGQNPEAWLPHINQNVLLRRILECFRPSIHDIEDIVNTPEVAAAREMAIQTNQMTPDMVSMIPQLVAQATQVKEQEFQQQQQMQEMQMRQQEMAMQQQQMQMQLEFEKKRMEMQADVQAKSKKESE